MWKFLLIASLGICQSVDAFSENTQSFIDDLKKEGRWAEIVFQLKPVSQKTRRITSSDFNLVDAYLNLSRREDALSVLKRKVSFLDGEKKEKLIQRINIVSETFLTRQSFQDYRDGLNHFENQNQSKALKLFERALSQEPRNTKIIQKISQIQIKQKRVPLAIEGLKTARILNPYNKDFTILLGRSYYLTGNVSDSVSEFSKIDWNHSNELLEAPSWYAESLVASNQMPKAIEVLEKDTESNSLNLFSLIGLAQIYFSDSRGGLEEYWKARKALQLGLSRMALFQKHYPKNAPRVEKKIKQLMKSVEESIALISTKAS